MFEKFTDKAIEAVMLAQEEARRLGHNFVGSEMLLLGVMRESGKASQLLCGFGLTVENMRDEVERQIGRGAGFVAVEIPFTPRAIHALKSACTEVEKLNHTDVSVPHLLLGIIDGNDSVAIRVFEAFGVRLDDVRDSVLSLFDQSSPHRM